MRTGRTAVGIIGSALIAFGLLLPLSAGAAPSADECKCEQAAGKGQGKFAKKKAGCVAKCAAGAQKAKNPWTDCGPPYAGKTAECVNKAESKAALVETKGACLKDCPECYSGGNCTADGISRTAGTEGDVDIFVPLIACDDSGSTDGHTKAEIACQTTMAKKGGAYASTLAACYAKCRANECKLKIPAGSCIPGSVSDPTGKTQTCITKADTKCLDSINKKCAPPGDQAECTNPAVDTAVELCAAIKSATNANDSDTYCESPSGAFLD